MYLFGWYCKMYNVLLTKWIQRFNKTFCYVLRAEGDNVRINFRNHSYMWICHFLLLRYSISLTMSLITLHCSLHVEIQSLELWKFLTLNVCSILVVFWDESKFVVKYLKLHTWRLLHMKFTFCANYGSSLEYLCISCWLDENINQ